MFGQVQNNIWQRWMKKCLGSDTKQYVWSNIKQRVTKMLCSGTKILRFLRLEEYYDERGLWQNKWSSRARMSDRQKLIYLIKCNHMYLDLFSFFSSSNISPLEVVCYPSHIPKSSLANNSFSSCKEGPPQTKCTIGWRKCKSSLKVCIWPIYNIQHHLSGVSKSRYFGISIPIKYSNFSRFYKKNGSIL